MATTPSVSISLTTKNSAEALDFYAAAFDAKELARMEKPEGGIGHAEFDLRGTKIFISDEEESYGAKAFAPEQTAACLFSMMSEDCDADHTKATEAGATTIMPPTDQFYGARIAIVRDPYGYRWCLMQIIEELSPLEIAKRAKALNKY